MSVRPVPEGFHTVTPHIVVQNAGEALDWYTKAFGAETICRMDGPGGKLMHAEFRIGNCPVMMCDEFPEMPDSPRSPKALGGTPVTLHLYVDDVDAAHKRAVEAGGSSTMPPTDMFWGDRYSRVDDPYGHSWAIATHKEDLTEEQMQQRAAEAFSGGCCGGGDC